MSGLFNFILCVLLLLTVACGGGGSDFKFVDDSPPPEPNEPIVEEQDLTLLVYSLLTVDSSSVSSGGSTTVRLQIRRITESGPANWDLSGLTINFYHATGTSRGTFGSVDYLGGGLYTTTFTGSFAGTTTEIYAIVQGFGLLNDTAPITVTPGALSLSLSTLSSVPGSIFSGANSLVTLTTRDISGNLMGSAGSGRTVVFSLSSGAGVSTGTFSPVADNGSGIYSATFTGGTAGSAATISATVNGSPITSSLPTVQVLSSPPPSDLSYLTYSEVTVSSPTVAAGTGVTLTLRVRQTDGLGGSVPVTTGGLTVFFFNTLGTSTGTIGTTTDNGDGTYSATFTGQIVGTATTIRAIISGYGLVDDTDSLSVVPGALSLAQTDVTISPPNVFTGSTGILTLRPRDSFGNLLGTAGSGRTVTFSLQGGVGLSQGTISATTPEADGTYTAIFTGTAVGAAAEITGFVNASSVTSTKPKVLVLASPAPSLNSVTDRTFETGNPLRAGVAFDLDFFNVNTNDDSGMTYTCFFDQTFDSSFSTNCSALPGTSASFNTSTGLLSWTPSISSWGAYNVRVQGSKNGLTDTRTFRLNVRPFYGSSGAEDTETMNEIRLNLDANFAQSRRQPASNTSPIVDTWTNLTSGGVLYNGSLCNTCGALPWLMTSGNGWAGTGALLNQFRLVFNGARGILDLGTNLQDSPFAVSAWLRFSNIASTASGSVVFTNSTGTGNGITLKQSAVSTGRIALLTGREEEYRTLVMSESGTSLLGYWRMSDSAGTSPLFDSCVGCNQGLLVSNTSRISYSSGGSGVLEPGDATHRFNQTGQTYVHTDMGTKMNPADYTVETWMYLPLGYNTGGVLWNTGNVAAGESGNCSRMLYLNSSNNVTYQVFSNVDTGGVSTDLRGTANRFRLNSANLATQAWHHIVVTHDVGPANSSLLTLYVNGTAVTSTNQVDGLYSVGSANRFFKLGFESTDSNPFGYDNNRTCDTQPMNTMQFSGWLDEVAVYSRVLTANEVASRYRVGNRGVCRVGPLADNVWYHLGIFFESGKSEIYLARPGTDLTNSTPDCSINAGGLMVGSPNGDGSFFIGGNSAGGALWSGSINNIQILDVDGTSVGGRLDRIYQSTRGRFP